MNKRVLSAFLAVCFVFSLTGFSYAKLAKEEPYTINVSYPIYAGAPSDMPKVLEKVNEITLKKINAKVNFTPVTFANMANTYALQASSGAKSDLIMMVPGARYMPEFAGTKMIMPLDVLLSKYGIDITMNEKALLKTGQYQGKQYAIPLQEPTVLATGIQLLDDVVKKYKINLSKIKTMDDLDAIFEKVKKGEPNMQMFFTNSTSNYFLNVDNLGDANSGVLMNGGLDNTKVVNLYETKEYVDTVKKVREWYQKGYISKDAATSQDQPTALLNAKKVFAVPNTIGFDKAPMGEPVKKDLVTFVPPVNRTSNNQMFLWAVPSSCKNPQKSIEFINLMFKDPSLATLLRFGIEGVHYTKKYAGVIDTSMGFKTYGYNWGIYGNQGKYPIEMSKLKGAAAGSVVKYMEALNKWNKTTKSSKAYGFTFDQTSVKVEIAAITAVANQYLKLIETGSVDPTSTLKEFNQKLAAAGQQKVMAEKQRQLNAWLKTQKK